MSARSLDSCTWCYGTNFVHTHGGRLGDLVAGPAICNHEGTWRVVTDEAERAELQPTVAEIRARGRRAEHFDPAEPRYERSER
jgi:hypothetical protein